MNDQNISLPPLPEWLGWPVTVSEMTASEIKEAMQDYARQAIEHFLSQSGQYITNDASRQAAIDAAIEAYRQRQPRANTEILRQLKDVVQYLENETMWLEAAYGHNYKHYATEKARAITEKLKTAIYAISTAGRKRRGEPVAWLYEDELPDNYPYEAMFPYSKVDGVRMFPVFAPQPAAPARHPDVHDNNSVLVGFVDDAQPAASAEPVAIRFIRKEYLQHQDEYGWTYEKAFDPEKIWGFEAKRDFVYQLLYAAPVAAQPSVPEPLKYGREWKDHYVTGWNNCRAAMLAAAQAPQDYPTPEEEGAWQRMEAKG